MLYPAELLGHAADGEAYRNGPAAANERIAPQRAIGHEKQGEDRRTTP
ncbi:MAG: hypothetical protein GY723_22225 [bacterium]|nr:hypothetical protein [bacterium]MCP5070461.1 hypothetical protein [bacterium]